MNDRKNTPGPRLQLVQVDVSSSHSNSFGFGFLFTPSFLLISFHADQDVCRDMIPLSGFGFSDVMHARRKRLYIDDECVFMMDMKLHP